MVFALEHPNWRSYRTEHGVVVHRGAQRPVLGGPLEGRPRRGPGRGDPGQRAVDWAWHEHPWGRWDFFYALPAVQAALDAVPDPLSGLAVHRGRGGSSGTRLPRRPRPLAGAGAVELPEPNPDPTEKDAVAPSWIEPGFYDDHPAPMPDPSPLGEPAASA
jgi:hypothetical protein